MSSVKKNFAKGIGYIKRELNLVRDEAKEVEEFLSYYTDCGVYQLTKRRHRICKERHRLVNLREQEMHLLDELEFYKEYFNYTDDEIQKIPAATEASLRRDAKLIERERLDTSWTKADTLRVLTKAGIL